MAEKKRDEKNKKARARGERDYLEGSAVVSNLKSLLHSKVAPVRDLILLHHLGDGDEGSVVFIVDPEGSVRESLDVGIGTIGDGVPADFDGCRGLTVAFQVGRGEFHSGALVVGGVGGVEVSVGVVTHELASIHGDLLGEGLEGMVVDESELEVGCLAVPNGKIYLVGRVTKYAMSIV